MNITDFHPAVNSWFNKQFDQATTAQRQAWSAILANQATLIAAPTGSGKTLAAFLSSINMLVQMGLDGQLEDKTYILYISPLKALSNDVQKNLQQPLNGIRDELMYLGLPDVEIRAWVRTGDTPQSQRVLMRRLPPHILVTTPESLYILLSSESGRNVLKHVHTTIVDEIHALAGNKRGAHLTLSLERLRALCNANNYPTPIRIGLSATQKPLDTIAKFLIGNDGSKYQLVDTGHIRERDLKIILPHSPLEAVIANEVWEEIYNKLVDLIYSHKTTLIFVNTRRLAERLAHQLSDHIGEENVTSHHGSLAREHRLAAEQKLKAGKLKALVATASLELGIDIGDIDLVCQIGSPRYISTFLQRVGRSGHALGAVPKGRIFPLSTDELVECAALQIACQQGELDTIIVPLQPLDVLAQQIVAEVASREWIEKDLYDYFRSAYPYRKLTKQLFNQIVQMLADGFSTRRGRRSAYIHYDAVNGRLRARRGARLTALTNGGAIPDLFDYDVVLQPDGHFIGSLNEDFAFESLPGDIFQLGNTSYRILKIEQGKVYVQDAQGQPPNIPFWLGEAPGRSNELSKAVSDLRLQIDKQLDIGSKSVETWLQQSCNISAPAAQQLYNYITVTKTALGVVPTQHTIVLERFFDEVGDMHLVIHSPYGSRLNRAWGLALRKRFCRKFNFELQAAANDNNIVLSLGPTHSFPLQEVARYLHSNSVREILIQAMLDAPVFATRWRWNANIALAVPRNRAGKRIPAQFQRSNAEDLVAVIFPDQIACFENIAGDRSIPQHPLVDQTIYDCLYDNMDIEGLEAVLKNIENEKVKVIACDLVGPSPMAMEIINARPYAFLDDAPAEERRTLAIQQRHHLTPDNATELGQLDIKAIERVKQEAWPEVCCADELHDAIVILGFMTEAEVAKEIQWQTYLKSLLVENRVTLLTLSSANNIWVSAERLAQFLILFPKCDIRPKIAPVSPMTPAVDFTASDMLVEIIRSRLEGLGPVTVDTLASSMALNPNQIDSALLSLESEGFAIRGHFSPRIEKLEWCDRRLLSRIHRYTIKQLRSEIEPVSPTIYMRFLLDWQHITDKLEGVDSLFAVLQQLEGLSIPAGAWEKAVLPARLDSYLPEWIDQLCISGRISWLRLIPPKQKSHHDKSKNATIAPVSMTPIALIERHQLICWNNLNDHTEHTNHLSSDALRVYTVLSNIGAAFFSDIVHQSGLLRSQVESALGELVSMGIITSDGFSGLRALTTPSSRKPRFTNRRPRSRRLYLSIESAGRWSLAHEPLTIDEARQSSPESQDVTHIAQVLLLRYGIVFRKVLERETRIPPWRELLYAYRRMEARGDIRGGRFVSGFSGEQFALPEAVSALRKKRNAPDNNQMVSISAADPVNLTGIITPGKRVPALTNNRILFCDGVPFAINIGGKIEYLTEIDQQTQWDVRSRLLNAQISHKSSDRLLLRN